MLVLSRSRDEQVVFGSGLVRVRVVDLHAGKVRLGIEAPPSMPVHRGEIHDAIARDGGRDRLDEQYVGHLAGVGKVELYGVPCERAVVVQLPSESSIRQVLADGFVRFGAAVWVPPKPGECEPAGL